MASFTIYYGADKPLTAVGENQTRLLRFAERYPGWHSFSKDRATVRAVQGLEKRGSLRVDWAMGMFRLPYNKG